MNPPPQPTLEALLAHAGWMRALAVGLLGDPAEADDVVQDATLAALLHPPREGGPSRAWLATVVRNFAWRRKRAAARRAEREERAARPEGEPSHEGTLERLDLQRVLLDAVRELEEPLRSTVVQRYFEGRTSAEIARASGVPAGTVRWRLKRGLDELRGRLDRRCGSREAWAALLAPLVPRGVVPTAIASGSGTAATTSLALEGALAMTLIKLSLAAAALVVTGLYLWNPAASDEGDVSRSLASPTSGTELQRLDAPARDVEPAVATVGDASARESLADDATPDEPVASPPVVDAPEVGYLDVRFVDRQGTPWPGVQVRVLDPRGNDEQVRFAGEPVVSDATGGAALTVALQGLPPLPDGEREWRFSLLASRAGCATHKLTALVRADEVTHLGDVVLEPGVTWSGRVVDEAGIAVAGARVGVAPPSSVTDTPEDPLERVRRQGSDGFDPDLTTESAADGTFTLAGVGAGTWRAWAHAEGRRYGWTEPLEASPGSDWDGLEVVLAPLRPTDRITGQVLDPQGRGSPGGLEVVSIGHGRRMEMVQTDVDGRFELLVDHEDAVFELTAFDGQDRYAPETVHDVRPGDHGVEIRFAADRALVLRVRDAEGRPVSDARVDVDLRSVRYPAELGALGPGELRVPCPSDEFHLEVIAPGYHDARRGPFHADALPEVVEVVLERAPAARGRVTAEGRPVAGARVALLQADSSASMTVQGLRCLYWGPFPSAESVTDAEGRFELPADVKGAFWLRAEHDGWAAGELGPVELAGLDPEESLELELTRGGAIEGYVLVPAGQSGEGRVVVIHHGDGQPRSTRAGPEGFFRFEGLTPGGWQVLPAGGEIDPHGRSFGSYDGDEPLEWSCQVEAGATTRFDLDLSDG